MNIWLATYWIMQAVNLLINMIEKNFIVNKSAAIEKTTTTIIVKKTSVETGLMYAHINNAILLQR